MRNHPEISAGLPGASWQQHPQQQQEQPRHVARHSPPNTPHTPPVPYNLHLSSPEPPLSLSPPPPSHALISSMPSRTPSMPLAAGPHTSPTQRPPSHNHNHNPLPPFPLAATNSTVSPRATSSTTPRGGNVYHFRNASNTGTSAHTPRTSPSTSPLQTQQNLGQSLPRSITQSMSPTGSLAAMSPTPTLSQSGGCGGAATAATLSHSSPPTMSPSQLLLSLDRPLDSSGRRNSAASPVTPTASLQSISHHGQRHPSAWLWPVEAPLPRSNTPVMRGMHMLVYDHALMERATMGTWRKTVSQVSNLERTQWRQPAAWGMANDDSEGSSDDSDKEEDNDNDNDDERSELLATREGCGGGFPRWNSSLYDWMAPRMGTRSKVVLMLSSLVFESCRWCLSERAYEPGVNLFSIIVATNGTSLLVALAASSVLHGWNAVQLLLKVLPLLRFMGISFLFTLASVMVLLAYRLGTPTLEVVTLGYSYLPLSAVLSYYVFRRRYGVLEWASLGMMSLALLAFVLLREESTKTSNEEGGTLTFLPSGFGLVVGAVAISAAASIAAERTFKEQRPPSGSHLLLEEDKGFCLLKVHLDLASLLLSLVLWLLPWALPQGARLFWHEWARSPELFGTWTWRQGVMVLVAVGQGWAAGLITKEFSTVIKAIVQSLSVVLCMLGEDALTGRRHFHQRALPSLLLAVIIGMSALIFQTGRLNLQTLRQAARLDAPTRTRSQGPRSRSRSRSRNVSRSRSGGQELVATMSSVEAWTCVKFVRTYGSILLYIMSDAGRTLVLQKALQVTVINSTSLGLVCYICGCVVASLMSLKSHGTDDGLRAAWDLQKIWHCLPAAFLFSLATALGNMAFAEGLTSALFVVLGKFYTPVAALAARFILGKFYMWLEWFALMILTLASATFGYLQAFPKEDSGTSAPVSAVLLVLASAAVSASGSLVTERILKGEVAPFHIQKVRLDAGSIISSIFLLPVLGCISGRARDRFWESRLLEPESCHVPQCFVGNSSSGGCWNPDCTCECGSGVFAGWESPILVFAVLFNTVQGWLVGRVTKEFSVIHRAIADSFSLLTIYSLVDPIFNHTSLSNMALNLIALIVPVSTATFSAATTEMQKVFQATEQLSSAMGSPLGESLKGSFEASARKNSARD